MRDFDHRSSEILFLCVCVCMSHSTLTLSVFIKMIPNRTSILDSFTRCQVC
ncbi:hypothetical protein EXN66_Car013578 [Channa argus]|uniref:Uncharacterized protein n=1 Tax=Channa argus TaxID=215402 RepID=A0A6G1Q5W6_CHAAH|nr:hypothetical protein EXN66_Car013578 [Channa argus]